MSALIAVAADLLVAVLLVATIATSVRLSRRMSALKADETQMRGTIRELVLASETAERAILGLRSTVNESEAALAERLGAAARHSARLAEQVAAGEAVLDRVAQVAALSRKVAADAAPAPATAMFPTGADANLRAAVLAARDLVERSARRREERAA